MTSQIFTGFVPDPQEPLVDRLWREHCEARQQAEATGAPRDWMTAGVTLERFTHAFERMPFPSEQGMNVVSLRARLK